MNISGFDNLEQIGEGGMATVWKAHQVSLDRIVAIKILKHELTMDPAEIEDFIREAKSAASLKHPGIIQVYDAAEQDGVYYFVMEYVAGKTIADILNSGLMPWKKSMQIILAMALALEYAWDKSTLIHRDVKPGNIMLDDDGTVKLADLGLAKRFDTASLAEQIQVRQIEGTPNYMSPEQARCQIKLDFRTDMYSLGATLYHMVTGKMPFEEYTSIQALEMHMKSYLPNPRDILPSIPLGVAQLITKMMMKNPNDRFSCWSAAIKEIKKVAAGRVFGMKQDASAKSTVEPQKKAISDKTAKALPEKTPSLPWWIRVPAWSVILLWWTYLAVDLMRLPGIPSIPKPLPPPKEKPAVRVEAVKLETPKVAPKPVKPPVEQPALPAHAITEEEQILLHSIRVKVAEALMGETSYDANAYIEQEKQYSHSKDFDAEIKKLEQYLSSVSTIDKVFDSSIKEQTGKEIILKAKGADIPAIVRGSEDGKIKLDIKTRVGASTIMRPLSLPINQVPPQILMNWLGKIDSDVKRLALFNIYFKGRNYDEAAKMAEKCGPIADALKMLTDSKKTTPQTQ